MCSCQRTVRTALPELFTPGEFASVKSSYRKWVGVTGVEPVTLRLSSACSNQLSYTPNKVGGAEETRTPDL
jgi:hypothetical protein